ncbi:MAG TPA: outer membrane beta-barrel protein [Cyclobacteriaceae bacterium]|nr:outer membrane beta-barrel protein [Cyclobacteriaceae bacterium]
MKAIFCILFLAVSVTGKGQQANADSSQVRKQPTMFGFNVGIGFSDLPGLPNHSLTHAASMGFGWLITFNDHWRLAPELNLSTRGTDKTDRLLNAVPLQSSRTQFSTFNMDVPVVLHYQLGKRVFAGIGVQFSYLLIGEQSTTGRVVTGEQVTVIENIRGLMHKEGFMIPIEIGVSSQGKGGICFTETLRYNLGVMEAFTTSVVESKYQSLQLYLTMYYRTKRGR